MTTNAAGASYALRHAAIDLGALDDSVPTARLHARMVLIGWGHADLAPAGELVVSELVTNGVRFARLAPTVTGAPPPVRVRITERERGVLIEVWDGHGAIPEPRVGGADPEAVYPLRDEFWVWHLGERDTPQQHREEAEIMLEMEPHDIEQDPAGRSGEGAAEDALVDISVRRFPDGIFQLADPVGVCRSHTKEQILDAYPAGPQASCVKCRSTYVMDHLALSYMTGEWVVKGARARQIV
jgi:hypothetical protein